MSRSGCARCRRSLCLPSRIEWAASAIRCERLGPFDTGIALSRLGEATRAEPLICEGLRREKAAQQRGRALHAFWLATTQLQQGKLDAACDSAGIALSLTASIDSPRVTGHVREFHHRLAPYAREAPVIEFERQIRGQQR
ncbi:hypothetical protein [Streptomyces sp. NPDC058308]|uniref:hypothetical protein n=1 Tax=Streptomyces sp. NPDC058308 TaxID=3346440 RepID=UPI0036E93B32